MKVLKIDRGSVEVEIEGDILRISGEAMLPNQASGISEYILYQNTLHWQNIAIHPSINEQEVFAFLKTEFAKRNLLLIIQ